MPVEIYGLKEARERIGRLPEGARGHIKTAFDAGLRVVMNHAKDNHPPWEGPNAPKIFNPDGTWRYHNITTNLTKSINLRSRQDGDKIEGEVGAMNEFARGDAMKYASKMERDHPYIGPAVEAEKGQWLKFIEDALRQHFK